MKTWSVMMAVLVLGLSASLLHAEDSPKKAQYVRGKITKIDGVNVTVQPAAMGDAAAPAAKTFATDDKTVVTQGSPKGDKKAVSDLAVDQTVGVKLSDDGKTAVAIVINPKMGGGGHAKGATPGGAAPGN